MSASEDVAEQYVSVQADLDDPKVEICGEVKRHLLNIYYDLLRIGVSVHSLMESSNQLEALQEEVAELESKRVDVPIQEHAELDSEIQKKVDAAQPVANKLMHYGNMRADSIDLLLRDVHTMMRSLFNLKPRSPLSLTLIDEERLLDYRKKVRSSSSKSEEQKCDDDAGPKSPKNEQLAVPDNTDDEDEEHSPMERTHKVVLGPCLTECTFPTEHSQMFPSISDVYTEKTQ